MIITVFVLLHIHRVHPKKRICSKVLIVSPEFGWGGMGIHSLKVAGVLLDGGYEVIVHTTRESRSATSNSYSNIQVIGLVNVLHGFKNFHPLFDLLSAQRIRTERNVGLVIRAIPASYFCVPSLRNPQIPEIAIVHNIFHDLANVYKNARSKELIGELLLSKLAVPLLLSEKAYLKRAKTVVAVSKYTKRRLERCYGLDGKKIAVIYNFVDTGQFKRTTNVRSDIGRKVRDFKNGALLVAFVGRREVVKNLDLFCEIARGISSQELKFVVIGVTKEEMEALAGRKLDNVLFLSYVDNLLMPEIYSLADFLMMTSLSENLPSVLLEAMACGAIPISTNVGGVPEAIQNGSNGFIVNSNKEAFLEAIHQVVGCKQSKLERLSCNARATVKEKFDIANARKKFVNLVTRLTEQRARSMASGSTRNTS